MTQTSVVHLRVVAKGYDNHTGEIGGYEFVDGVSVDPLPMNVRDRLAAAMPMEEVDADGNEQEAGVAARILREKALQADLAKPLKRQSEEDKAAENAAALLGGEAVKPLYSRTALEAIAEEEGIAGIRAIVAEHGWNARSKAIPDLITLLLDAQNLYAAQRIEALVKKGAARSEAEALFALKDTLVVEPEPEPVVTPEPVIEPKPVVAETISEHSAAETGDLAAAVNAPVTEE